eukprot:6166603-Prymnesium_polylepis.2
MCVVIGLISTGEAKADEAAERQARQGMELEEMAARRPSCRPSSLPRAALHLSLVPPLHRSLVPALQRSFARALQRSFARAHCRPELAAFSSAHCVTSLAPLSATNAVLSLAPLSSPARRAAVASLLALPPDLPPVASLLALPRPQRLDREAHAGRVTRRRAGARGGAAAR